MKTHAEHELQAELGRRMAHISELLLERIGDRSIAAVCASLLGRTDAADALEHLAVSDIEEIRLYSTRPERRQAVAEKMTQQLGVRTVAVDHPREAVEDCQIVTTATNSNNAVFDGDWLQPGTHVNTMIGSDSFLPRRETDDETVFKSDLIVVNSKDSITLDKQPELHPHLESGKLSWDNIYDIGELMIGKAGVGRTDDQQITYHNNNVGMGIQFAAMGRLLYEKARKKGIGTELNSSLFMQYDEDLREIRDTAFLLEPE